MAPSKFGVGQSVWRKEDDPLLRGGGRYVADHLPAGVLHAWVREADSAIGRAADQAMAASSGATASAWSAASLISQPVPADHAVSNAASPRLARRLASMAACIRTASESWPSECQSAA